ncbi:MAG: hypothetical protein MJ066_04655 [Clostridia bacterium]|nr:hypothetical protein [Clostridia bacterium]
MKKIPVLLVFLIIINTFAVKTKTVYADTEYLRVITTDTPFYSDEKGENLLFYLQYTYYVKVLGFSGQFTKVEYLNNDNTLAVDGFVPTEMLFCDNLEVSSPYPNKKLLTSKNTILYQDYNQNSGIQYVFQGRELTYYGYIYNKNEKLLFVEYNDNLGYIKESDVVPYSIENHPNDLTFIVKETITEINEEVPVSTDEQIKKDNSKTLKIVIVSCIAFAGIISLFIAFRSKPNRKVDYYDENYIEN